MEKKIFGNKKGVSPLIATVLLIAFAIALGAVIMNWGKLFTQEMTTDTSNRAKKDMSCNMDLEIQIDKISGNEQICYNNTAKTLTFILKNTKYADITNVDVQVLTNDSGIYSNISVLGVPLLPGKVVRKTLNFNTPMENGTTIGGITKVIITPKITINSIVYPCTEKSIERAAAEMINGGC